MKKEEEKFNNRYKYDEKQDFPTNLRNFYNKHYQPDPHDNVLHNFRPDFKYEPPHLFKNNISTSFNAVNSTMTTTTTFYPPAYDDVCSYLYIIQQLCLLTTIYKYFILSFKNKDFLNYNSLWLTQCCRNTLR